MAARLCRGCVLNPFEKYADPGTTEYKFEGALIFPNDKDFIEEGRPDYSLVYLANGFEPSATQTVASNDRAANETSEADAASRTKIQGQLQSHAERVLCFQHRTTLFMLFINGDEFRIIRWGKSGGGLESKADTMHKYGCARATGYKMLLR